ncbi:glycerate kinase [uncultured Gemmiger sp.]|uniref:glycerate kinase n=1 Tax=uncultured Gemmiger sp. TaxID=1623490 RepID=UPI0025D4AF57|nr:glycerate kinase [uncultured Gemmiger sp.]
MQKIVLVPDAMPGALSAARVCDVLGEAFAHFFPEAELVRLPLGSASVLQASAGEPRIVRVQGPAGNEMRAAYTVLPDRRTAIVDAAACAGAGVGRAAGVLPGRATSYGVGQMILDALQTGCREILLCLSAGAGADGGTGCAAALGVRFLDASGRSFVPVGDTLKSIAHIDLLGRAPVLAGARLRILAGSQAPLCGPQGPAWTLGLPARDAANLDEGLGHLAAVTENDLGIAMADHPGAGAAGGLGAGAMAYLGGELCPGVEPLLDLAGFDAMLEGASLVVTAAGRLDAASALGSAVSSVALRARQARVPVLAFGGVVADGAAELYGLGVTAMQAVNRAGLSPAAAAPRTAADLRRAAEDACRLMLL